VVVLRYWSDLSVEQVATMLDCSTGNVKSQSARALDKLRVLLADAAGDDGPAGRRHGMNETMGASDG
jgi:DNA-directed RNA polymerase specialized sigma24 family protein